VPGRKKPISLEHILEVGFGVVTGRNPFGVGELRQGYASAEWMLVSSHHDPSVVEQLLHDEFRTRTLFRHDANIEIDRPVLQPPFHQRIDDLLDDA
jgi:hypothetical protein